MNTKTAEFLSKYQSQLPLNALSELKEIFEELNFLETVFGANPCTISLIDEKGNYVKANAQMLKLVNIPKEKFL
jgi:PAS domain-containing protein